MKESIGKRIALAYVVALMLLGLASSMGRAADRVTAPMERPAIKAFLNDGFGSRHTKAPPETAQFGQLVGLWHVETEMARRSGGWAKTAPGVWAWKYTLDGFAVSDLWYQGADNLPSYMADLGRDYLLTANRIYNVSAKQWQVAWMANGAGTVMGADVGDFTGKLDNGDLVMTSADDGPTGMQRVVFYEIGDKSFRWRSEFSQDSGKTWITVMRMHAKRIQ